jgi:NADH-quinone oxidoreductase subunit C
MDLLALAAEKVEAEFGESIQVLDALRNETHIRVDSEVIVPVCQLLHDDPELTFNFLITLTAIDYWPEEPRFQMAYQLYSVENKVILGLRVDLFGDEPKISTVESVYPNANWHEREVYDLFGIVFEGHSDLRRIVMPHDWEGHPLRKDYPLGYEEVQFSFNFDEIDDRKKYAQD